MVVEEGIAPFAHIVEADGSFLLILLPYHREYKMHVGVLEFAELETLRTLPTGVAIVSVRTYQILGSSIGKSKTTRAFVA